MKTDGKQKHQLWCLLHFKFFGVRMASIIGELGEFPKYAGLLSGRTPLGVDCVIIIVPSCLWHVHVLQMPVC